MTSRSHLIDLPDWVVVDAARRTVESHDAGQARLCGGCRRDPEACDQLAWARRQLADSATDTVTAGSTVRR